MSSSVSNENINDLANDNTKEQVSSNPMLALGLMDEIEIPYLRSSSEADLFSLNAASLPQNQFNWMKRMDHGSSNTLLSQGYEDQSADFSSQLWVQSSCSQVTKSGQYKSMPIRESAVNEEKADTSASEILDTIQMLGAETFSKSFVDKIIEDSILENYQERAQGHSLHPQEYASHEYGHPDMYGAPDYNGNRWVPPHILSNLWSSSQTLHLSSLSHSSDPNQEPAVSTKTKKAVRQKVDVNSSRRKTIQHAMDCYTCKAHVGLAFLRGSYTCGTESPVKIQCNDCYEEFSGTNLLEVSEKKRKRQETKCIDCEICHSKIGNGSLNLISEEEVKSEFVCVDCGDKYMFCSECGGGGKQRTGKWRPKELFEQGRRTCSLPHIRVGSAEMHYKVIPVDELTTDILLGIQDVFFDCMLSLYCVPSIMSNYKYGSFEDIKHDIERLWLTSVLDVLTNKVLNGKKYITVAWIHKRHRNKGIGRSSQTKETMPWIQKLNLAGIIKPPFNPGHESEERHHCFVAFSIAEWVPGGKNVFLAQMAPRSVFLKTMEGYIDLIKNCIDYIKREADKLNYERPTHIWCWTKADHARLQSIPARLKFHPKEEYLAANPHLISQDFEREDYEPVNLSNSQIFITSLKQFNLKSK